MQKTDTAAVDFGFNTFEFEIGMHSAFPMPIGLYQSFCTILVTIIVIGDPQHQFKL